MSYRETPGGEVIHCDICQSNPSTSEIELSIGVESELFECCDRCRRDKDTLAVFRRTEERRFGIQRESLSTDIGPIDAIKDGREQPWQIHHPAGEERFFGSVAEVKRKLKKIKATYLALVVSIFLSGCTSFGLTPGYQEKYPDLLESTRHVYSEPLWTRHIHHHQRRD
jgi:hypothetical protein